MKNPLAAGHCSDAEEEMVKKSLNGDKSALDQLIHLHQPFIYNVAWKMVHDPNDALDLTQEVLIKVITKLSQFNFKSSFKTWLYRIVVNEFLQTKRRKTEGQITSFDAYGAQLEAIPNPELNTEEQMAFEELSKEMQVRCMSGMLMCLNREQRLIYILGDTFAVDHHTGAEIFDTSAQNFRVKLHRARKDLYNYMNNKCGLVNKENPCRCPKKAKALKEMGMLDEKKMTFNIATQTKVSHYVEGAHEGLMHSIEDKYTELYRDHPAKDNFSKETVVEEILRDDDLMQYLSIA